MNPLITKTFPGVGLGVMRFFSLSPCNFLAKRDSLCTFESYFENVVSAVT